jgi:hypothetical protein
MGTLLMPQETNSTEPTGGVMVPIHILNVSTTPNWTRSMPRLWTMGRKIGVKIRQAGVISRNIPTTRSTRFIRSRITYLLVEMDMIALLMAAGIPVYAITHDIADDAEIRNRMIPLVAALLSRIFIKLFRVRER